MMTRDEALDVSDAILGAQVTSAFVATGVLVLELFHRGTDDGAHRLVVPLQGTTADAWPWPQGNDPPARADRRAGGGDAT